MLLAMAEALTTARASLSYLTWLSSACQFSLIDIASNCHYLAGTKSSPVITCFSRSSEPTCSGACKSCHENVKIETQAWGFSKDLHAASNSNVLIKVNILRTEELSPKNVKIKCFILIYGKTNTIL